MKDRIVNIKSGVDINSDEFKTYYDYLKSINSKTVFLDMAVKDNSQVLSSPIVFNEKDYCQVNVDDISFIWMDDRIICHTMINVKKLRFVVPLSAGSVNHIDENLLKKQGSMSFSKIEQVLIEDIDVSQLLYLYITDRINGKLEKTGIIAYEKILTK